MTTYAYSPRPQSHVGYSPYSGMGYQEGYAPGNIAGAPPSVAFRKRMERIDWRKIASVDVDQIARNMDFNALQENITNITFCNIEAELDLRNVDPNFTKLFKLAQLTIEYLLHSQDYLAGVVTSLEEKLKTTQQEHEQMTTRLEQQQKELTEVKKESHKRKKMLAAQQQLLQGGSSSYNKCPYCSKAFLNASFLQAHIVRRHGDSASPSQSPQSPARLNTALEKELLEIKERLKMTETLLQSERSKAKRELFTEKNVTNVYNQENKENLVESFHVTEKPELSREQLSELEKMKKVLMTELKEMNEKYQASQNALSQMEQKYGRRSHLGELRDDEDDHELLRQQREELAMLKEQLHKQTAKTDMTLNTKLKKQDRKWEKKVQMMSVEHANELSRLNAALEKSVKALERNQHQAQKADVQQLLKETKEKEKLLKAESNRQVAREKERLVKSEPRPSTSAIKASRSTGLSSSHSHTDIDPFPDDDTEESDEEEEGLHSPLGTGGSLGHTGGTTGEFSTQRSNRLLEQLRQDPFILKAMREELVIILDEQLERKGIPQGSKSIKDDVLATKQSVLNTERKAKALKYPTFTEIRQRLQRQVTEAARERYKQLKRSPPSSGNRTASNSTYGSSRSVNVHQGNLASGSRPSSDTRRPAASGPMPRTRQSPVHHQPTPSQQAPINRQAPPSHQVPPKPTQRSTSPWRNGTNTPLQSTGSTTEWTSTNWDSDEEEEEDSEDEGQVDGRLGFPQASRPVPRPRASPSPRAQPPIQTRPPDNISDWDSDGVSDLEELDLKPTSGNVTSQARPPVAAPKGQKVAELSRSIEFQLSGRKGQKPAGAVDTMGSSHGQDDDLPGFKDDDSFPDISSLEENDGVAPIKPQKHAVGRASFADTDQSSNTYGTSKWGSSSRAMSSPAPSSVKDSVVSLTDWDSDISDI
ncbi:LOW QUALITY PROTEIN: cilium assembly protein DZIP1L-like [Liolophura sinensis]|uniref:LOW QUALITY PROTEIN: cilium assembly protein DZIP1L-like n=1 Tax=Liolophura sinensis TaxID=3198878 RepID=UPI003158316F